jgi:hypothetical protein
MSSALQGATGTVVTVFTRVMVGLANIPRRGAFFVMFIETIFWRHNVFFTVVFSAPPPKHSASDHDSE